VKKLNQTLKERLPSFLFMSLKKAAFKREGTPTVSGKKTDQLGVVQFVLAKISLNGMPDNKWTRIFENPPAHDSSTFTMVNPTICDASIDGSSIIFKSKEADIDSNVKLIDTYLEQVNKRYNSEC